MKPIANNPHPRILFVDHSGLPGGGQLGLARFLENTKLSNVEVLLLGPGHAFDRVSRARGFSVETLDSGSGLRSLIAARSLLRRTISNLQPDLIVANSNKAALILASLAKHDSATRIYYMRDDLNPARKGLVKRTLLGRWMHPRFDKIIANSRWTASTIPSRKLRGLASIAYPVSGTTYSIDRELADVTAPLRILSLSRIAHWKGIHVLLEAARLLETEGMGGRFSLTIAGTSTHEDPAYEKRMWALGHALSSPVHFIGHIDDIDPVLRDHDILIACSISTEPFGQVVVQGLAAGLVTIASNEGGPQEIITSGKDGYLIAPGDSQQLASVLKQLMTNPEHRLEVSNSASRSARRFSDSTTVEALEEILIHSQRNL